MIFNIFKDFSELKYGISQKGDGPMNIKIARDVDLEKAAENNRRQFLKNRDITDNIFLPNLVHGSEVRLVNLNNCGERLTGDGFLSNFNNLFLTVTVADCFPLYFYDPAKEVIGLAHNGWRGVGKNIVRNMISAFRNLFGSRPEDIRLGIGPGIRRCHFTVYLDKINALKPDEPEAVSGLMGYKSFMEELENGKFAIDLDGIIEHQAREEGLVQIERCGVCTYCAKNDYFSYRRDGSPLMVMLAYIGREDHK